MLRRKPSPSANLGQPPAATGVIPSGPGSIPRLPRLRERLREVLERDRALAGAERSASKKSGMRLRVPSSLASSLARGGVARFDELGFRGRKAAPAPLADEREEPRIVASEADVFGPLGDEDLPLEDLEVDALLALPLELDRPVELDGPLARRSTPPEVEALLAQARHSDPLLAHHLPSGPAVAPAARFEHGAAEGAEASEAETDGHPDERLARAASQEDAAESLAAEPLAAQLDDELFESTTRLRRTWRTEAGVRDVGVSEVSASESSDEVREPPLAAASPRKESSHGPRPSRRAKTSFSVDLTWDDTADEHSGHYGTYVPAIRGAAQHEGGQSAEDAADDGSADDSFTQIAGWIAAEIDLEEMPRPLVLTPELSASLQSAPDPESAPKLGSDAALEVAPRPDLLSEHATRCKEPIRTRTMARLLAGHGYYDRALSIYDELIARAPHDRSLAAEAEPLRSTRK